MNNSKGSRERKEVDLEMLLFEALHDLGALVPETEEQVARAEQGIDDDDAGLPEALKDASAVFDNPSGAIVPLLLSAEDADVRDNLARAAREGRVIDSLVEVRMKKDRASAEQDCGK